MGSLLSAGGPYPPFHDIAEALEARHERIPNLLERSVDAAPQPIAGVPIPGLARLHRRLPTPPTELCHV
jgi:hypothetical protein